MAVSEDREREYLAALVVLGPVPETYSIMSENPHDRERAIGSYLSSMSYYDRVERYWFTHIAVKKVVAGTFELGGWFDGWVKGFVDWQRMYRKERENETS